MSRGRGLYISEDEGICLLQEAEPPRLEQALPTRPSGGPAPQPAGNGNFGILTKKSMPTLADFIREPNRTQGSSHSNRRWSGTEALSSSHRLRDLVLSPELLLASDHSGETDQAGAQLFSPSRPCASRGRQSPKRPTRSNTFC